MQYFTDARIDHFIIEDLPYIDLTCQVLGLSGASGGMLAAASGGTPNGVSDEKPIAAPSGASGGASGGAPSVKPAEMEYFTREDCVLAGVAVVRRMMDKLGCEVVSARPDGDRIAAGESFMRVQGSVEQLHAAWKSCLNMFDHLSAVATKTRAMVDAVHAVNPRCEVLTTRKSMPGVKDLLTHAVVVGGAYPHRLGLSETVLVFDHHYEMMGGFDSFVEQLPEVKARCIEKKLFAEVDADRARILAKTCIDGIQLDKIPSDELAPLVKELRAINPHITLIAAGGINPGNAAAYAACGVDGLATTAPFSAKPLDMSIHMRAL